MATARCATATAPCVMAGLGPAAHDLAAAKFLARPSCRHPIVRYFRLLRSQSQSKRIGLLFRVAGKSWAAGPGPAMTQEAQASAMTRGRRPRHIERVPL